MRNCALTALCRIIHVCYTWPEAVISFALHYSMCDSQFVLTESIFFSNTKHFSSVKTIFKKFPYATQESLSLLAAECESGDIIEVIVDLCIIIFIDTLTIHSIGLDFYFFCVKQLLQDKYSRFRPAKDDANCFYRSFMFAYLVSWKNFCWKIFVVLAIMSLLQKLSGPLVIWHIYVKIGAFAGDSR